MDSRELDKLEGVWVGTEQTTDATGVHAATARLVFHNVFDGRFVLCDYIQTNPDRRVSVAHGVFRRDEATRALTVTWFRDPVATASQQTVAATEGEHLVFIETNGTRSLRTTYSVVMDRMSVRTESSTRDGDWKSIFEGAYRRR